MPNEPVYQAKRLSIWLRGYDNPTWMADRNVDPDADIGWLTDPQADEAVRGIGTNAIPILLKMLNARDTRLTLRLLALAQKQSLIRFDYVDADHRAIEAAYAFQALGVRASNAVPQLLKIYNDKTSLASRVNILTSLGYIGPRARAAIPLMLKATADTNEFICCTGLWSLASIHSQPEIVVPVLTKFLSDIRRFVPITAAVGLEKFGPDARSATSALLESAAVQNSYLRDSSLRALSKIYAKPAWKPAVPRGRTTGYSPLKLAGIIDDLGSLCTNCESAVPALVKFLSNTNDQVRISATNALRSIDSEAAAKAGVHFWRLNPT